MSDVLDGDGDEEEVSEIPPRFLAKASGRMMLLFIVK